MINSKKSLFFSIVISPFILLMLFSSCQNTQAESKPVSSAIELKSEIIRLENAIHELVIINEGHVKEYSIDMGCNGNSRALEIIKHHNELIESIKSRLSYHQLQLIQSDTANQDRNQKEMLELKKDFETLSQAEQEIRNGLTNFPPTHVTK